MPIPGTNATGTPDAIDSSDYVMTIIRAIRRFPVERKKEVEDIFAKTSKDMKDDVLKVEKAYNKGYLDALGDMNAFIQTTSRGI
jgi:hypothetical protein